MSERPCAWVTLVMIGDAYVPGALVVAASLRQLRTQHQLVCMVTPDVSEAARGHLAAVFDRVVEVPYIAHAARPLPGKKQAEYYNGWVDRAFTKWNCLALTEYAKVCFIDADIVAVANIDDLFELRAPAACFSLPWAAPFDTPGMPNPYLESYNTGSEAKASDLPHGARINALLVMDVLRHQATFVSNGFLVLLEPSAANLARLIELVTSCKVYGEGYKSTAMSDEMAIAELYCTECPDGATDWTHIHQRYAAIPWKTRWVNRDIRAFHYLGRKPWDQSPDEWPDLADWWRVADRLARDVPALAVVFRPTDAPPLEAAVAEYRLTCDLRGVLCSREGGRDRRPAHTRDGAIDECLARWLVAVHAGHSARPAWATVYRRVSLEDSHVNDMAGTLIAARVVASADEAGARMVKIVSLVNQRMGMTPRPTGLTAVFNAGSSRLSVGSHFTVAGPAVASAVARDGLEAAALALLRAATTCSPPPT